MNNSIKSAFNKPTQLALTQLTELLLIEESGAAFSDCRKYRYALWRIWDESKPLVMYIGLNPSKADEDKPDNTITKVRKVSMNNGYGGFYMTNLFSLVSQYPEDLKTCENPIMDNDKYLIEISKKCKSIVFCWGTFKQAKERAEFVKNLFPNALCLKITKHGFPWHPLYCLDETILIPYNHEPIQITFSQAVAAQDEISTEQYETERQEIEIEQERILRHGDQGAFENG